MGRSQNHFSRSDIVGSLCLTGDGRAIANFYLIGNSYLFPPTLPHCQWLHHLLTLPGQQRRSSAPHVSVLVIGIWVWRVCSLEGLNCGRSSVGFGQGRKICEK